MNFEFDVTDPVELAAHVPELEFALSEMLREHERLGTDIEALRELVRLGGGLSRGNAARTDRNAPRRRRPSPAQDRAVEALAEASAALAGTAVGPTSLYKFMVERDMDAPKDATVLGTNLWDAWQAGRIRRAPNGVYLPLDQTGRTVVDYPLTDYYYAAEQGMPLPQDPSRRHPRPQPLVGRRRIR